MKKLKSFSALVYSTNPDLKLETDDSEPVKTLPPSDQRLKVILDKKNRAGKIVTLISGFGGKYEDMEELGRKLRSTCGTGGSVKDGLIILQGDNVTKVLQWLNRNGYSLSK